MYDIKKYDEEGFWRYVYRDDTYYGACHGCRDEHPKGFICMGVPVIPEVLGSVTWGGTIVDYPPNEIWNLGKSVATPERRGSKGHGPRRMLWDAAFGYVNGFAIRHILYFVLTRSVSERVWLKVWDWEDRKQAKR